MSLRALLNGKPTLTLPSGWVDISHVADAGIGQPAGVTLEGHHLADERVWEYGIIDLGPDPRGEHSDSLTRDFCALYWPDADAVVVAGETKAVFIGASTGQMRLEVPLEFTGQSSLEVLELLPDPESQLLFVVSTRLVVAVSPDLLVKWTWRPEGILRSAKVDSARSLALEYYDATNPELPAICARLDAQGRAFAMARS